MHLNYAAAPTMQAALQWLLTHDEVPDPRLCWSCGTDRRQPAPPDCLLPRDHSEGAGHDHPDEDRRQAGPGHGGMAGTRHGADPDLPDMG